MSCMCSYGTAQPGSFSSGHSLKRISYPARLVRVLCRKLRAAPVQSVIFELGAAL